MKFRVGSDFIVAVPGTDTGWRLIDACLDETYAEIGYYTNDDVNDIQEDPDALRQAFLDRARIRGLLS